ncbi:immunity protein Tsi6 family protein [Rhodanobacter sp. AS-Z3]|uniref:immunity protein Tsi6 family protein n=1 Tax=Rhodanobacter sp. AS-Z3 TaxID=3031330 RepID=UPI002478C7EA|nr:immunity protein Tsi6 family protein [Rhodanobacter sp. AS-Z3]WEN14809.1 immunity protein Tsi6 family protein [Rhodanobacter sp. AS-Z3]
MIDRDAVLASVRYARSLLADRMHSNPGYEIYIHANEQLTRMLLELELPSMPLAAEREWVDLGLMAVKELNDIDREFASALMDADYDFKHADQQIEDSHDEV